MRGVNRGACTEQTTVSLGPTNSGMQKPCVSVNENDIVNLKDNNLAPMGTHKDNLNNDQIAGDAMIDTHI